MENNNIEPTVTITLGEYNRLRDEAMMNRIMIDQITMFEVRMGDIQRQIHDLKQSYMK